ncbi:DoxX family protein [Streptomyces sp. NPDC001698]|uniref:DoxX family protein n=1 Tax=Streptomyces sp. NPDC001698 TaxID=3364601 RepID=UPI00368A3EB9
MSLLRVAGRPLLASMFVAGGMNSLCSPEAVATAAEPVVRPITERVAVLPDRTEQVVRLSGGVQVVAGVLLGLGRFPRLSAVALAATLVPTTLAGHRFWEAEDDAGRVQQRIHFLKNLSMLGGLLIAADDTGGAPSLLWRGRHTAHELRREARLVRRSVRATARPAAAVGGLRAKLPARNGA